ncbi:hypothetical protein EES47_08915 [Streptomyces sp. ADI98-12]|nr:hypothetical protein EES47_08915 [Streptomyces sp. ADI98-12]
MSATPSEAPSYPSAMAARPRTQTRVASSPDRSAAMAAIRYHPTALAPSAPGNVFAYRVMSRAATDHSRGSSNCCCTATSSPEIRRWMSAAPMLMYCVPYVASFASHSSTSGPPRSRAANPAWSRSEATTGAMAVAAASDRNVRRFTSPSSTASGTSSTADRHRR